MPIDNYPIIRPWLHFDVEGDLYFVEIIRRGKDFSETGERLIRDYHLHSLEQFDELTRKMGHDKLQHVVHGGSDQRRDEQLVSALHIFPEPAKA